MRILEALLENALRYLIHSWREIDIKIESDVTEVVRVDEI